MKHRYKELVLYFLLFSFLPSFSALNSITPNDTIHENDTLVSAGGTFEAGIFSLGDSQRRYFGIWYKSISPRTIVWVANRDTPLESSSGVLKITEKGIFVITNGTNGTIWSSNTSGAAKKPVGLLLDSGNLVVKDGDGDQNENFLWQSFDYPGDTLLPGMKIASNLVTGPYKQLTSWRNVDDPTPGNFSLHIDILGYPQQVTTEGSSILYRSGPWNGYHFTGVPWQSLSQFFNYSFVLTEKEVYFQYQLLKSSGIPRYMLTSSGDVQRFTWSDQRQSWELFLAGPVDQCDNYALCGANSNCNVNNSPICECLKGFTEEKGMSLDRSNGCVRRTNLSCNNEDGFIKYTGIKLPDTSSSWFDKSINLEECETLCLKNCSCIAYANLDIRDGGSGCLLWFDSISDMRKQTSQGQDIYVRLAASEQDLLGHKRHINKKLAVSLSVITVFIIVILGYAIYLRRRKYKAPEKLEAINWKSHKGETEKTDIDLPTINLSTIAIATNNFSFSNILGEGGYGPVYKGSLPNGQRIAVKRLAKYSGQGPEEFKNEVMLLANLQHRNLVKIIGCCIQNDERILIYEFMPNKSLDYFIFDQTSNLLDWNRRFQIICGIARGLLYLHQDSRLKIIHRDLKPSNILLDENITPKISDFGIARIFERDQYEAKTKRVVGTYGYMSPEYTLHGNFSVKSDVFSFGVIVLEIVSGRKNREFSDPCHHLNLLGYAWRLWSEDKPLQLIDESIGDSITLAEASRSIIVGLLCVQERPEDRPDMSSVVLMLNGEKGLPNPNQPGFYPHVGLSSSESPGNSTNEISMTLDAR